MVAREKFLGRPPDTNPARLIATRSASSLETIAEIRRIAQAGSSVASSVQKCSGKCEVAESPRQHQSQANGLRKYLTNKHRIDDSPIKRRIAEVRSFHRRLEKRLARIPQADFDKPLTRPLCKVGYSNNAETRLKMYRKHTESN
ncbi:hypothetical protein W97_07517 [Coniosporium apollinis CBS 100218]|uniref:Uncharacterized protein n=1 Tax=Coniosporium apollinis (strain CBS 100218) TaxID=1168221 RepID=R7Z2K5_CONA1|nr:uncharacterized protein W97_07517 [Coniosporium apollinis CBS 100218]EON68259.1 hypothetical protein W97_07517 [Coniosporium apollinis CBS 100218]